MRRKPEQRTPIDQPHVSERISNASGLSVLLFYGTKVMSDAARKFCSPDQAFRYSHLVAPCIILFHAFIDAYINEWLCLNLSRRSNSKPSEQEQAMQKAAEMGLGRVKLARIQEIVPNLDSALADDIASICDLRDIIYHYDAQLKPMHQYPQAVHDFLQRAKIPITINSNWLTAVSNIESLDWIERKVREFVEMFSNVAGHFERWSRQNPPGYEEMWENIQKNLKARDGERNSKCG